MQPPASRAPFASSPRNPHPRKFLSSPTAALAAAALAAASLCTAPTPAPASTVSWAGGPEGLWSYPGNWSPMTVPVAGDDVVAIPPPDSSDFFITLDTDYPPGSPLKSLTLDSTIAPSISILQDSAAYNLSVTNETLGSYGRGGYEQSAGTHTVSTLDLGLNAGSTGTYSLSATGVLSDQIEYLGDAGTGTFTQTGGTHSVPNALILAYRHGSHASYSLSGSSTLATNWEYIGYFGSASFSQIGSTHTVAGSLFIGYWGIQPIPGSSYTLSNGGSLAVAGDAYVGGSTYGPGNTGVLSISASSASVAGTLKVFATPNSSLSLDNAANLSVGTLAGPGPVNIHNSALTAALLDSAAITLAGDSGPALLKLTAPASTASSLTSLSITHFGLGTAKLDLGAGSLVLDYTGPSPAATIRSYLLTGRGYGNWDAPNGIVSSAAAADPQYHTAIAYAEASDLLALSSSATALWQGRAVDSTSLLLRFTSLGDFNLDGIINADDYALIDRGFQRHRFDGQARWIDGDANYDGIVDMSDYLLTDHAYSLQTGSLSPSLLAAREAQFGPAYLAQLSATLPDPAAGFFLLPALLLPRRRKP